MKRGHIRFSFSQKCLREIGITYGSIFGKGFSSNFSIPKIYSLWVNICRRNVWGLPLNSETAFLFLNSSVVWFVISAVLMKVLRLKSLVLVLIIAPFVICSTLRDVAGMPELIGFYGTSILYGALGIVGGILYMEYAKAKAYFKRASKTSFIARSAIALSSLYLLSYFAQSIILNNPMVQFALNWIEGGDEATKLLNHVSIDGVYYASGGIVAGISVLAINKYLEYRSNITNVGIENFSDNQ